MSSTTSNIGTSFETLEGVVKDISENPGKLLQDEDLGGALKAGDLADLAYEVVTEQGTQLVADYKSGNYAQFALDLTGDATKDLFSYEAGEITNEVLTPFLGPVGAAVEGWTMGQAVGKIIQQGLEAFQEQGAEAGSALYDLLHGNGTAPTTYTQQTSGIPGVSTGLGSTGENTEEIGEDVALPPGYIGNLPGPTPPGTLTEIDTWQDSSGDSCSSVYQQTPNGAYSGSIQCQLPSIGESSYSDTFSGGPGSTATSTIKSATANGASSTSSVNTTAKGAYSDSVTGRTASGGLYDSTYAATASGAFNQTGTLKTANGNVVNSVASSTADGAVSSRITGATASGGYNTSIVTVTHSGDYSSSLAGHTASGETYSSTGHGTSGGGYSSSYKAQTAAGDYVGGSSKIGGTGAGSGYGGTGYGGYGGSGMASGSSRRDSYSGTPNGEYTSAYSGATSGGDTYTGTANRTAQGAQSSARKTTTVSGDYSTASRRSTAGNVFNNTYHSTPAGAYYSSVIGVTAKGAHDTNSHQQTVNGVFSSSYKTISADGSHTNVVHGTAHGAWSSDSKGTTVNGAYFNFWQQQAARGAYHSTAKNVTSGHTQTRIFSSTNANYTASTRDGTAGGAYTLYSSSKDGIGAFKSTYQRTQAGAYSTHESGTTINGGFSKGSRTYSGAYSESSVQKTAAGAVGASTTSDHTLGGYYSTRSYDRTTGGKTDVKSHVITANGTHSTSKSSSTANGAYERQSVSVTADGARISSTDTKSMYGTHDFTNHRTASGNYSGKSVISTAAAPQTIDTVYSGTRGGELTTSTTGMDRGAHYSKTFHATAYLGRYSGSFHGGNGTFTGEYSYSGNTYDYGEPGPYAGGTLTSASWNVVQGSLDRIGYLNATSHKTSITQHAFDGLGYFL